MISAKIVADSIGPSKVRLTTFVLTYPRFIHSEFMTHRMISRNASSSRAIPVKKQIQMVMDNPAIPIEFRKNQKGMQAGEPLENQTAANALWLAARDRAVDMAEKMADLEVHKQYANRLLEPFARITVVATATEWSNFFALRCHEMAQPEIHALADQMYEQYATRTPRELLVGEWHLPFVTDLEHQEEAIEPRPGIPALIRKSVARCARVSYLNHDGHSTTLQEDTQLYRRLLGSNPIHASPAEHQAMATTSRKMSGNLRGWIQYRKTLKNENITQFKPDPRE